MNELKKIITAVKNKTQKPIYFLMGDEPYYIDLLSDYFIENVISEEEKSFNEIVLYGKDVTPIDVISQARQFPFMGDKMLVVVKEAQEMHKTIDQFIDYLKAIQTTTILVICFKYKSLDKRKELYKALSKNENVEIFESLKVKDYQLDNWIKSYVSEIGLEIEAKASAMLAEFLGNDLSKIVNEIGKIQIILKDHKKITAQMVEQNIGISKDYNNFELIKAIVENNEAKAFKIGQYFALNSKNNPLVVTIAVLYNFFSKLLQYHGIVYKNNAQNPNDIAKQMGVNPYALKDYQAASKYFVMKKVSQNIAVIREIDLKGKGVNANLNHDDLLKELLIKIFR